MHPDGRSTSRTTDRARQVGWGWQGRKVAARAQGQEGSRRSPTNAVSPTTLSMPTDAIAPQHCQWRRRRRRRRGATPRRSEFGPQAHSAARKGPSRPARSLLALQHHTQRHQSLAAWYAGARWKSVPHHLTVRRCHSDLHHLTSAERVWASGFIHSTVGVRFVRYAL